MRIFILAGFLLCFNAAFAQTEFSLYRLHNTLPQSNMLNPAFAPRWKLVIGLPVISSARISADLDGVTLADMFNNSGTESLSIDTVLIPDQMKEVQFARFSQSLQLLYLGRTFGKSYVSIGLHEVSELRMTYPGDLIGWAIRGPGDPQYVGRPLDLGSFYAKGLAYNKASVSLGRSFGDRLRVGARFSYLLGLGMVESTKLSGQLYVGIDSVTVQTGELQVNTSGIDFFTSGGRKAQDYVNFFVKTGNQGVAWDFGATYQISRRLSVSASVTDIGFITWKDYTKSYHLDPVTYTFKGIDFLDYLSNSGQVNVDDELDSLRGLFTPTETVGEQFSSPLIGKAYAGVNYHFLGINNLSALVYFDLFQEKLNPAVSLGYTVQLGRMLNATVGVTFHDRKIDNIGAGLALRLFKFQVFATSDRAQSIMFPARASRADIHAGLNLVFGKPHKDDLPDNDKKDNPDEKKEEKKEDEKKKEEPEVKKAEPEATGEKAVAVAAVAASVPSLVKKDSVIRETPREEPPIVAAPRETTPPVQPQVTNSEQPKVTTTQPVEERHEIVTQGTHRDELPVSHYVVVGTFGSRDNAERYSRELRKQNFDNKFGYASEKSVYYVYVYKSKDLDDTRRIRDRFRQKSALQLPSSWVLSVVDGKLK
jgi:hypothetical protein